MIRKMTMLSVVLLLISCADTHQLVKPADSESFKLDPFDGIYVSVPRDGVYGSEDYAGSGVTTAQIIQAAFLRHTNNVRSGDSPQSIEEALEAAKDAGSMYLVLPVILHWEDRATEWSGKPDRVEVKIQVIEVATNLTTASAIAKGKSGLATFGGDRPQDLLPEPIGEFVSSMY